MDSSNMLKSMMASIANDRLICERNPLSRSALYNLKYTLWLLAVVIFSPRKTDNSKTFVVATGPIHIARYKDLGIKGDIYCFAKLNDSINKIRNNVSVISKYNILERIKLLIEAVMFYKSNKAVLKGYLPHSIEYYWIVRYLYENRIEKIIFPGIYERYSTLVSYYGHFRGVNLIGIQDAAAIDINCPSKIYCDVMYCFDKYEEETIKRYFADNRCEFRYVGFTSMIRWSEYTGDGKKIIAIASQDWFTEKTKRIIDVIYRNVNKELYRIVVYPHYRENRNTYDEIVNKYPDVTIESKVRYKKTDLLVTFYSTIVYDFWSVNKDLPVICVRIPGYEPSYYQRPNVIVCDTELQLTNAIIGYQRSSNGKET